MKITIGVNKVNTFTPDEIHIEGFGSLDDLFNNFDIIPKNKKDISINEVSNNNYIENIEEKII